MQVNIESERGLENMDVGPVLREPKRANVSCGDKDRIEQIYIHIDSRVRMMPAWRKLLSLPHLC